MLRLLPLVLVLTTALTGLAQADELTIEGMGIGRDVDCLGKDVGVYGSGNTITLTGKCGRITIQGSKHTVSFEEGAALVVEGIDHNVTGGKAQDIIVSVSANTVSATLGGADGRGTLNASGANNAITLVLTGPSRLEVNGSKHVVEWSRADSVPNPEVTSTGYKNVIKRKK